MGNAERTEGRAPRVIKRYSNRKLYDTRASSYVTLLNISDMVRSGEHVQVIDNATKEDKTDVTLALIISEELKANPRDIPVAALDALVTSRGGRLLLPQGAQERDREALEAGPEGDEESMETEGKTRRGILVTLQQVQQMLDERISVRLPQWAAFQALERRVGALTRRVEALERGAGVEAGRPGSGGEPGPGAEGLE